MKGKREKKKYNTRNPHLTHNTLPNHPVDLNAKCRAGTVSRRVIPSL